MFAIGPEVDLTYQVEWLGDDLALLGSLPAGPQGRETPGSVIVGGAALKVAGGQAATLALVRASGSSATAGTATTSFTPPPARTGGLMLGYAPGLAA